MCTHSEETHINVDWMFDVCIEPMNVKEYTPRALFSHFFFLSCLLSSSRCCCSFFGSLCVTTTTYDNNVQCLVIQSQPVIPRLFSEFYDVFQLVCLRSLLSIVRVLHNFICRNSLNQLNDVFCAAIISER